MMRKMDQFMADARGGRELIDALDEERRKVEAFHRELPLCLQLINQTIESYKQLMMAQEERSRSCELAAEKDMQLSLRPAGCSFDFDPPPVAPEKPIAIRATKSWGEALDFDLEKEEEGEGVDGDCDGEEGGEQQHGSESSSHGQEIKKGSRRKERRFWSEELHKRFLQALDQLGGCHAATPKHIRKLMKVDGLTNDEVKSHLQKFRLHARRRGGGGDGGRGISSSNVPQFVVAVGGLWIPSLDCTVVTSTDAAAPATNVQADTGRHHQAPPLPLLPSKLIFLNQTCSQQQLQHITNYESQ